MRSLYKAISYLTYPALWGTVGIGLYSYNTEHFTRNMILSALLHSLIPLLFVLIMVKLKKFDSIELPNVKHRSWVVLFSLGCAFVFQQVVAQQFISSASQEAANVQVLERNHGLMVFGQLILVSLLTQWLFNRKEYKISIHILSFTGFVTHFLVSSLVFSQDAVIPQNWINNPMLWIGSIGLLVLVGISRYRLKSHKLDELFTGFLMGISIVFINLYAYHEWGWKMFQ